MVYIKRLVANGFKSFGKKTEVLFDKGINVIVGPNGSGKSNISDAMCFALGRLSIKSMRAAKSHNLIFMGSKYAKPAGEASVEVVFDNIDRGFSIEKDEISLKRIIRRNGQGIYKINDETKTRNEMIEMLLQAGIDPYGFNIILQGQIQSIVKMHPEERRKIIEEVAGISIYELRKEKSLKELAKTDEKLKEISYTLRQRTAYLKNLETERAQALRYKDIENTLKRTKASIINKKMEEKQKELDSIFKSIEEKNHQKEKIRAKAQQLQVEIDELGEKINQINKHIRQASGVEQEGLHSQVANLKAEIEGLRVRKENYQNRKVESERRIEEMTKSIPELEREMSELRKKSPLMAKKVEELKKKKEELEKIEEEKKKLLSTKTELTSLKERLKDKERHLAKIVAESESALRQIEEYSGELLYKNEEECLKTIDSIRDNSGKLRLRADVLNKEELENEKIISVAESEIQKADKIKHDVREINVCPLCQSKITENHKEHVHREANARINEAREKISELKQILSKTKEEKSDVIINIRAIEEKISLSRLELVKHKSIKERQMQLKKIVDDEKAIREELHLLDAKRNELETRTDNLSSIEEKYDVKMREIEEISSRNEEDLDNALLYREREVEGLRNAIKRSKKDLEDLELSIKEIIEAAESKEGALEHKEEQERELNEKFKKMFETRDKMTIEMQNNNLSLSELQNEIRMFDDQVNYLKVGQAGLDAQKGTLQVDMGAYAGVELIKMSMPMLEERLTKADEAMREIGSINMRALEVYEDIKKEYDIVQEKSNTLVKEKDEIMKIIDEIDRKKTRTFMRTFHAINELFTRNFAKLYAKGTAFLEVENKENIFAGGVDIAIRLAKGKYFDVTSLSGGEQTMVALALLFAIQEHKPYHFYIFDEIDAALDKRNSERLAGLLNQYMKSGQYIVITHNDAIIMDSDVLYGVSMHDGVTKILSLNLNEEANIKQYMQPAPPQAVTAQIPEVLKEENPFKDNLPN
jgi:chromosome segregation protein